MKLNYEIPKIEIIYFETEDVLDASPNGQDGQIRDDTEWDF